MKVLCRSGALLSAGLVLAALTTATSAQERKVIELKLLDKKAEDTKAEEKALREAQARLEQLVKEAQAQEAEKAKRQGPSTAQELEVLRLQLKKLQDEEARRRAEIQELEAKAKALEAKQALERAQQLKERQPGQPAQLPPGVTVTRKGDKLIIEVTLPPERKQENPGRPGEGIRLELKPGQTVRERGGWEIVPGNRAPIWEVKPGQPLNKSNTEERLSALEMQMAIMIEEMRQLRRELKEKK
jgi:hypothetical protein